jgi:hypothetical protein
MKSQARKLMFACLLCLLGASALALLIEALG